MTDKLLIHIGYQKTATTWLQNFLFKNTQFGFTSCFPAKIVSQEIIKPHPLDFQVQKAKKHLLPALKKLEGTDLVPVLSQERLSGCYLSGEYDCKEIADRLAQVFPDAKVLIVIREQVNMLLSLYKQYIWRGETMSIDKFLQPSLYKADFPVASLNRLKFHRLVGYYQQKFGKDRVLVLPYELFQTEPVVFVEKIMEFCGNKTDPSMLNSLPYTTLYNKSFGMLGISKRYLNMTVDFKSPNGFFSFRKRRRFLRRLLHLVDEKIPSSWQKGFRKRLHRKISQIVEHQYQESNRLVAQMANLNLEKYRYDLEKNK